jgi:hypothetical protein
MLTNGRYLWFTTNVLILLVPQSIRLNFSPLIQDGNDNPDALPINHFCLHRNVLGNDRAFAQVATYSRLLTYLIPS